MANPIKIVYSWIGPKGPIINTELPNILCFSAVAEGAKNTSDKYWSDDIYWRIFLNKEAFTLGSTFGLANDEIFIYPFTLMWRTPFETYFFPSSGLLEFSHTPNDIIHKVRQVNGYFLLECAAEAWVRDEQLRLIHGYFGSYNIPMNKIIYLTGCMNAEDIYEKWCNKYNIPNVPEHRMHLISYPSARYAFASSHMSDFAEPQYDTETIPEKLFLCWNRRFRPHRSLLMISLDKLGLVDRSYYSMGKVDPEFQTQEFIHSAPIDLDNTNVYNLTREDLNNLVSKLPLEIDGETEIGEMCADRTGNARKFYQNSLLSIVTETNWDLPHLTSTEKSFKPFRDKHPFIIVGVDGALKSMRNLGFKTFSEFWDESYDEIEDCHLRLLKIIEVCNEIGSWNNEQILHFKRNVKSILDHNYQVLKNTSTAEVADMMKEIVNTRIK